MYIICFLHQDFVNMSGDGGMSECLKCSVKFSDAKLGVWSHLIVE